MYAIKTPQQLIKEGKIRINPKIKEIEEELKNHYITQKKAQELRTMLDYMDQYASVKDIK